MITQTRLWVMVAGLLLVSPVANADANANLDEWCASVHEVAAQVMQTRQSGAPMHLMMKIAGDAGWMRLMVMDAFDHPHYQTAGMQYRAQTEFANKWAIACYKAGMGGGNYD